MVLNSKYQDLLKKLQQYEQDHQDSNDCWDENDDCYSDKSAAMYLISQQRAREALIEELQIKNAEMKKMLDDALCKSTENSHNNEKTTRKLQNEIELLRSSLDIAAQKIQQLEELRHVQKCKDRSNDTIDASLYHMQDQPEADELTAKIIEMHTRNDQLTSAKHAVEAKLHNALMDLQGLRQQLAQFQYDQQEYISLKEAYQRQFKHIEELTSSLEDHRNTLSHLRACGIAWSPRHSPATSEYGNCYNAERHGGSIDTSTPNKPAALNNSLQMDLCMTTPKQSLLYELENEWLKRLQKPDLSESQPDHGSSLSYTDIESHSSCENDDRSNASHTSSIDRLKQEACLTEHNIASLYNASSEYALEMILSCAAFNETMIQHMPIATSMAQKDSEDSSIRGDNSVYSTYNLYPHVPPDFLVSFDCQFSNPGAMGNRDLGSPLSKQHSCTFLGLFCWVVQCAFSILWRWCRFSLVLLTAILINLWHGPDAVLEK